MTELHGFFLSQAIEPVVEIATVASLVLPVDIPRQEGTDQEDEGCGSQIDSVAGSILRSKIACVGPCTDDGADCSEAWDKSSCNSAGFWSWNIVETP